MKWTLRLEEEFTSQRRKDIPSRDCTKMRRCVCRDVRDLLNDKINTRRTNHRGRPLRRGPGPPCTWWQPGRLGSRISVLLAAQRRQPLAGICGTASTRLPGKRGILSPPLTTTGPPTPTTPSSEALVGLFLPESHVHKLLYHGFVHWGEGAAWGEATTSRS